MATKSGAKPGFAAAMRAFDDAHVIEFERQVAEQLPLLPAIAGTTAEAEAEGREVGRRGPGRPKGSVNKATEQLRQYLLDTLGYRHPALILAETMSRPAAGLAAELGISRGEAFRMQLDAARDLLPYLAPKLLAVKADVNHGFTLILDGLHGDGQAVQDDGVIDIQTDTPSARGKGQGVETQGETPSRPTTTVQLGTDRKD